MKLAEPCDNYFGNVCGGFGGELVCEFCGWIRSEHPTEIERAQRLIAEVEKQRDVAIETIPCDQNCGAQIFTFGGTTCGDCLRERQRDEYPPSEKASEWLTAMAWLDAHAGPDRRGNMSLPERLQAFWDEMRA